MPTTFKNTPARITTLTTLDRPRVSIDRRTPTRKSKGWRQSGQASVEFLLTFAFGVGFTVLFVALTLNTTKGYLVHYANFMASRAFLTHDVAGVGAIETSIDGAAERAASVFASYPLASFGIKASFKINKPTPMGHSSLMSGTTATFEERVSPMAIVGGDKNAVFHSESFLTKEPVRLQCLISACAAMGIANCNNAMDITVFDNGC